MSHHFDMPDEIETPMPDPADKFSAKPNELWAVRGKHLDHHSDQDIRFNRQHYEIWTWSQCYDEGKQRFNLAFLGKWRSPETNPFNPPELCSKVGTDRYGTFRVECTLPKGHKGEHGGGGCEWNDEACEDAKSGPAEEKPK